MSVVKGKLKDARDALAKKDYDGARDIVVEILDCEPDNYHANVFLGLALLELGQFDKSEQAYRAAIRSNPELVLAWQGLSKFYERTKVWEDHADALQHLIDLFFHLSDAVKCAETLQKLVELRRTMSGTRTQTAEALLMLLPESPIYPLLSTLPPPDPTQPTLTTISAIQAAIHNSLPVLEEIVTLLEKDEAESVKKEIEKRRTRLGAPDLEQLKKDVGSEIWGNSRLPNLYHEILNHPNTSDDLRRATDSKLLRHRQQYLYALPISGKLSSVKAKVAREVESLVDGAVVLRIPDELAWMIYIEGKDCEAIEEYDYSMLRHFMDLFPSSPLTSLLKGYFIYTGISLSGVEESENPKELTTGLEDDPFETILDTQSVIPDSLIANRIWAEIYLREKDYQNAIKVAQSALALLCTVEENNVRELPRVRIGLNVILITSLVHFVPPKHHSRAIPLIDNVLSQSPNNVGCLMGRAYILRDAQQWSDAGALFAKVVDLIPGDLEQGLRAEEEHAWCQSQVHDTERGLSGLHSVLNTLNELEDRDLDRARCLWRIGMCYWEMGTDKRDESYRYFIMSLKCHSTYAPAFTSLGIYYSECASPPDPVRASKCFQKAFELDAREAYSARKLAEGFAEEGEWDLVDVIARRVIDGEGGSKTGLSDSDEGTTADRYLPTNAWAWKAVGVIELTHRNYTLAIQAFQSVLRAEPLDQLSWLRLGEAYSKAGRYAAAVKALERARELQPDDWVCSYLIGELRRQTGHFQGAIESFESILEHRPSEVGVLMCLGQTHLDLGRAELSEGFTARAEQSFVSCIRIALKTIEESPGFRHIAWKVIADAAFLISYRFSFIDYDSVSSILLKVNSLLSVESRDRLSDVIPLHSLRGNLPLNGIRSLEIAIAAYDYRISLGSSENAATASAWFDLGVALCSWAQKVPTDEHQQRAESKAIACLTAALRADPENEAYWIALGDANFSGHAEITQHAYIKALEINPKSVVSWTNLGLLYLHHNELELADQALCRAQTFDPDYSMAWVGEALLATARGNDVEARAIIEHVMSLSTHVPEADLEFGLRFFMGSNASESRSACSFDELVSTFFILERYCKYRSDDASALHLFGLVCERLGQVEFATDLIDRAISILEAAYEDTEDPEVEQHFMIANSNMARLRLSLQDYNGAILSYESALGLLSQEDYDPTTCVLRAQLQLGCGLVNFKLGDLQAALGLLETALETSGDNLITRGEVMILLAQTLWAIGSEDSREIAKSRLLECITTDPENLTAITALAGMGILTEDDGLLDAALSEILTLPLERRRELDPQGNVNYLLIQHHLGQGAITDALSLAQRAVFVEPYRPEARNAMAALVLQCGKGGSAIALLPAASLIGTYRNPDTVRLSLSLRAVAEALLDGGNTLTAKMSVRRAQKAVMLSPQHMHHWKSLAYIRSKLFHG